MIATWVKYLQLHKIITITFNLYGYNSVSHLFYIIPNSSNASSLIID